MPEIPRHPAGADDAADPDQPTPASRRSYLLRIGSAALVMLLLVLHLTGVLGPGGH